MFGPIKRLDEKCTSIGKEQQNKWEASNKIYKDMGSLPYTIVSFLLLCPEAIVTQCMVSKQGILKSLVSHFLNFKSWIELIYDTVDKYNFVINEFTPTFEVQNMGYHM